MPRIFISYRRADSAMAAGRIHDRLAVAFGPENVFKDVDDIPPGVDFRKFIAQEVEKSDVMLVLIGQVWLTIQDTMGTRRLANPTDFVRIEVETGLSRGEQCRVVPVLLGNTSMPREQDLPTTIQDLIYLNAVKVRDDPDFNRDVDRLIRWLRGEDTEFDVQMAIQRFFTAYMERRWTSALELLAKIRDLGQAPIVFDADQYENLIQAEIEREEVDRQRQEWQETAEREYNVIQIMVEHEDLDRVWECWQIYCEQYESYDPQGLGAILAQRIKKKKESEQRERAYTTLYEQVNQGNDPEDLQATWEMFQEQYGDHDPLNLARLIADRIREKEVAERRQREQEREREYIDLLERFEQDHSVEDIQVAWKLFQPTVPE